MRKRVAGRFVAVVLFLALAGQFHCVHSDTQAGFGIQSEHAGYIPARTAVLPCSIWPNGARYKSLELSNAKETEIQGLCAEYDRHVLDAFNDQPYMNGYSPKFVVRLLVDAGRGAMLEEIPGLWQHTADDCMDCETPPAFYTMSIAGRSNWLAWLHEFSKIVRNADAVLIPFVMSAWEQHYPDRGLMVAKRAAFVTLLLVDTNNGNLLWAGGREAAVPNMRLENTSNQGELAPPPWDKVFERLFVENLWREFPGRQVF